MTNNIHDEHISAEITISIGTDGMFKLSGDKFDEMDKRYYEGEQIYLSKGIDCLQVESYRGNLSEDWKNITPKWTEYSKMLVEGKLPEEFEQLLKGDAGMDSTVTSNMESNNTEEDVVKESGINSEPLVEIFDTSTADDANPDDKQEDLSAINTDTSALTEGDGLNKLTEKAQNKAIIEAGKAAVGAMSKVISGNTHAVSIDDDAEEIRLKKLMRDPIYQSAPNKDGSYTIAKSQIRGHKYEIRVAGELNSSTFATSVNVYMVDKYKKSLNVSAARSIPTRNIRQGGTILTNHILGYGSIFTQAEANYANGRLFVLIMKNQLEMQVLDPLYSYSETLEWFRDYIINGIKERHNNSDNKRFCHPEIYLEEVANGPRSGKKGMRVVIGIWDSEFRNIYKSLVDEGLAIKESDFLKQGKQLHDLLPDAGRGGGQHTPGFPTSERYSQPRTARIQRFRFEEDLLHELWKSECEFRKNENAHNG